MGGGGGHPDPEIRGGGPPGPLPGSATGLFSFRLVDKIRPSSYRRDLMHERAAKSGPEKILS